MTAAEASKIILNIVEFLGSPISVLRFRPSEFHVQLSTLHSSGFCAPPDLNRGLNFFLCHPKIDFLRDCQNLSSPVREKAANIFLGGLTDAALRYKSGQ